MVPAVTEVWWAHAWHIHNPRAVTHDVVPLQDGQMKPFGHRNRARNARQAASSANHASNACHVAGKSTPALGVS